MSAARQQLTGTRPGTAGSGPSPWRLCVAPMMDWTDRHCRYFHRVLSPHARLYTEMVAAGALLHGNAARHLDFHGDERPLALQLGGAEPAELAQCARLGERWGYSEINLNCGCPSTRVQHGAFGACLMAEPARVADCVRAMRDAVSIPVTVKHRIGIDRSDEYRFVHDFVGVLREAGCSTFIVHARSAWLDGLSPKENRELPPLRYDAVRRLKRDFPDATIVLNGGLHEVGTAMRELEHVDGVMLGRAAYHWPWALVQLEQAMFDGQGVPAARGEVVRQMSRYLERACADGVPPRTVARAMLGLFQGSRGAGTWRRLLSDPRFLALHGPQSLVAAADAAGVDAGNVRRSALRQDPSQALPAAPAD
jgi:tRNA-dihydrouridine synthase A